MSAFSWEVTKDIGLCICISTHCFKSLLGMYLYLDILMNVMSKKSVKVIPGLDVSNFFSGRESTCLSCNWRGFPCGYDFILSKNPLISHDVNIFQDIDWFSFQTEALCVIWASGQVCKIHDTINIHISMFSQISKP